MDRSELSAWELPKGCGRILLEDVPPGGKGAGTLRISAIVLLLSPSGPVEWSCKATSETTGQVQSPDGKVQLGSDPREKSIVVRVQAGAAPGWYDKTPTALVPRVRG